MIRNLFRFHPVGQGLFYSGRIGNFTFVYDCGTADKGALYLDKYIEQTSRYFKFFHTHGAEPTLDLLIVSHFHEDHIKGIKALLDETGGAKQIIVPYLHPAEKLFLLVEYRHKNNNESIDGSDFLNALNLSKDFWGDAEITVLSNMNRDNSEYNGKNIEKTEITDSFEWSARRSKIKNHTPRPDSDEYLSSSWKFRFYCNSIDEAKLNELFNELNQNESQKKLNPKTIQNPKQLSYDIRNRYAEIEQAYKKVFASEEMNYSSLVCYHGPEYKYLFSCMDVWTRLRNGVDLFWEENHFSGQMLTGDLELGWGQDNSSSDDFLNHYANELPKVGLCSIPHHGSEGNWSKEFFEKMNNCQHWICSFGLGNRHKHPNISVIESFNENCKLFTECNQLQGVNIKVYSR